MTADQLMDKFLTLTNGIGSPRAKEIAVIVAQIEDCDTLAELSRLLTVGE